VARIHEQLTAGERVEVLPQSELFVLTGDDHQLGLVVRLAVQLGVGPVLVGKHHLIARRQLCRCVHVVSSQNTRQTFASTFVAGRPLTGVNVVAAGFCVYDLRI